jgi:hypothetical protein
LLKSFSYHGNLYIAFRIFIVSDRNARSRDHVFGKTFEEVHLTHVKKKNVSALLASVHGKRCGCCESRFPSQAMACKSSRTVVFTRAPASSILSCVPSGARSWPDGPSAAAADLILHRIDFGEARKDILGKVMGGKNLASASWRNLSRFWPCHYES